MIPKGVWVEDKDSFLYFRTTGTASASINEIQFNPNSIVAKERISVPVQLVDLGTTIDSVIEQNPGSQFALKLDIEGAEHQVIQYLSQTSRLNLLKKLWIEYHYGQQLLMNDIAPVFKFIVAEQKSPEMGLIIASN
jgi:FkbM family methyltransferase